MSRSWATFRSRDSFGAIALRRNTYHSIRLDELNKNPSTAHTLVEICPRYRSFSTAHAQLPNSSPIVSQLAYSGAEGRDESNEMCLVAGRRFVPEIASAHVQCDETHIIRFVSTSRTRIRQLRIDWLRSVRDIAVFLLRMRSNCDCATAHAQTKTPISRRDLNQSMRR